jgi:hypothetical protein
MNPSTPSQSSGDSLEQLKSRLAEMELRLESMQSDAIPWHVIVAAVAAVMPGARVVRVAPASSQSLWHASGLLRNISSHQLRHHRNR